MDDCDVAVFHYQDRAVPRKALRNVAEAFGAERAGVMSRSASGGLFIVKGRYFALRASGQHLIQVAGPARQRVTQLADRLRGAIGQ